MICWSGPAQCAWALKATFLVLHEHAQVGSMTMEEQHCSSMVLSRFFHISVSIVLDLARWHGLHQGCFICLHRYAPNYDDLDGGSSADLLGFSELRADLLRHVRREA